MSEGSRASKRRDLRSIIGLLMGVSVASTAAAQTAPTTITIDSSFGRTPGQLGPTATNTTVTGNRGATYNVNNLYTIAESQGRTAGANLFHSFGTFNVGAGDAAIFTTATSSLQNIIARVSGPSASTIQGLLAVNAAAGSNPNLFLINPAGVTFGAGAIVDVPAAFHVSTANELRFADGTAFKAGVGPDSSMTMAAPEAFGFVGGNAAIAFNGVQADGMEGRRTYSAGSFDVTAGTVTFDSSMISVPQAQVRLLANGATANSIPIDGAPMVAPAGDLRLTGSRLAASFMAPIDAPQGVRLGDAGSILLSGRNVTLDETLLFATFLANDNAGSAGTIRILAGGDVTLKGVSNIQTTLNNSAGGRAGTIEILAQGNITAAPNSPDAPGSSISTSAVSTLPGTDTSLPIEPGDGIILQGGSVSLRNTTLTSLQGRQTLIRITSGSTISVLERSQIVANQMLVPGFARAEGVVLRSLGGGDIVIRDSRVTSGAAAASDGVSRDLAIETAGDVLLLNDTIGSEGIDTVTGAIVIRGDEIVLDGTTSISVSLFDGLGSRTGGIGSITLDAANRVVVGSGASIQARAVGTLDNPGDVTQGQIRITTPRLELDGQITTETTADFFFNDRMPTDPVLRSRGNADASNIVIDGGNAGLVVQGTGIITSSSTLSDGDAGSVTLLGRDINVAGVRLQSASDATSTGTAGNIQVTAENQLVLTGAQLQTDTASLGKAGGITLAARTGSINASQIQSQASAGSSGQAGTIAVSASESLALTNSTLSVANDALAPDPTTVVQGLITVDAPTVTLSSSLITAESSMNVAASSIAVNADSSLTLDQSTVSSTARGTAAAGDIAITSNGTVTLRDSSITGEAVAANTSQLTVTGADVLLDGTSRLSTRLVGGPAMTDPITTTGGVGAIRVSGTNRIAVGANSSIDASAVGSFANPDRATPGEVRLTTPQLDVAGTITTATFGNVTASNIVVESGSALSVTGAGVLTSSTAGTGNAGNIDIGANDVALASTTVTSATTADGSAGTVTLHAANRLAVASATVRTDTSGAGKAGNVALTARTITIEPSLISSQAASGSSGQTGTIDVSATNAIELRDSALSIANAARVVDPSMTPLGRIRLGAPVVKLFDSNITAQSSENVGASAIAINAPNGLTLRNSNVTTSAQDGNGGDIDVLGRRFIVLDKSQINTSVLGSQSGSGGDITVRANVTVVNNGFIQANTAAAGASGGNVVIDVGQLLPVGALATGGDVPLLFDAQRIGINAIQAAAPDGVSGMIQLAGPSLDVVGNLQRVEAEFVATGPLGQDLCRQGNGSSLTQLGRGGLRPLSTGLLRPDTSLPLLPELPTLRLSFSTQPASSGKCGH